MSFCKKTNDIVPQSRIIECLIMNKISDEIIIFIENTMENWRVNLTAGGKSLAEMKIRRGVSQGVALSPLLFVIAMMPLSHMLRKWTGGLKFHKSQEKINHRMYMDIIKQFVKNQKEVETLIQAVRIYSDDIGTEFGREKCAMLIMKSVYIK